MRIRKFTTAFALALVLTIIQASFHADGAPADQALTQDEFSFEVFLNRGNVTLDTVMLSLMVEDEKAVKRGDGYLLSAKSDPDLFVLVRHLVDDPGPGPIGPYHNEGVSIRIGLPMERESTGMERENLFIEAPEGRYFGPDLRWIMREEEYHLLYNQDTYLKDHEITFAKDGFYISFDEDESGSLTGIDLDAPNGRMEELEDIVLRILDKLNMDISQWDPGSAVSATRNLEVLVSDTDTESLDWRSVTSTELDHLLGTGLISNLSNQDVKDISTLAAPGLSGPDNRIIEFKGILGNENGTWMSYLSTTFPLHGSDHNDSGPHITSLDMPDQRSESPEALWSNYYLIPIFAPIFLIIFTMGLMFRVKANNLLKNAKRKEILETIRENPGIHFREVMRELDMKQGVLSYHLNKLEKAELVKSRQDGMYRRFFLYDSRADIRIDLSDLQVEILLLIRKRPGINQSKISKKVGRSHVLINYHVRFLKEAGMVDLERSGRETNLFLTSTGLNMAGA